MKPVIFVKSDLAKAYDDYSYLTRIKDRFRINLEGESFINELDLRVARIKFPPNFNKNAYLHNIHIAKKFMRKRDAVLALKTIRIYDYELLSEFQKRLFAYSVVRSIKLFLRVRNKNINSSCVVIYDAANNINNNIIFELAKECRYCILLSNDIDKISRLSEYVIANFGVSPIVTKEVDYALASADFIVSSEDIDVDMTKPIWYINNLYRPKIISDKIINDVTYKVPWNIEQTDMSFEILGAILEQMGEKDIETSLKYNGIYLDTIKFNNMVIH